MEGIREIARSYYERASEDEKKPVIEFFVRLDTNRDAKITLFQFKKFVSPSLSSEDIFRKLDKNGDGALDFDDVLCLYYMEKKMSIGRCSECSDLLVGPYFSCTLCFQKRPAYHLCCSCYCNPNLSHEHPFDYMLDHHSLIRAFRDRTLSAHKTQKEKEMEELREIAIAHYRAGSSNVQALAYEFYKSMDSDGDRRVNFSEFIKFAREEGYTQISDPYFFEKLDLDGNGTLDYSEVMTLYYIIKSGRPLCNYCRNFIPGIYFSCVECFKNPKNSFHLCGECYRSTKCTHNHNGRTQFLDNYTLLQTRRDLVLAQPHSNGASTSSTSNSIVPTQQNIMYTHYSYPNTHHPNQTPTHSNAIVPASNVDVVSIFQHDSYPNVTHHPNQTPTHSNAIVPASNVAWPTSTSNAIVPIQQNIMYAHDSYPNVTHHPNQTPTHSNSILPTSNVKKWKVALEAFEIALSIGSISTTLCTIL